MVQESEVQEEESITLQNQSDVTQHVFVGDRREAIYPRQMRTFPIDIARQFLEECPRYVVKYRPVRLPEIDGHGKVWIANTTGNPFLPEKITLRRKVHGVWEPYEKLNPLRNPFPVSEWVARGQTVQPSAEGDGDESLNHPPMFVEIAPYERVLISHPIAEVLYTRDGYRDEEWRGQIAPCRAPGSFEANETWSLDEVRLYATLMDATTFKNLLNNPESGGIFPPEEYYKGNTKAVKEAKKKLLDMLFFRMIDDRYNWPSEAEFKMLKGKMQEAARTGKQQVRV